MYEQRKKLSFFNSLLQHSFKVVCHFAAYYYGLQQITGERKNIIRPKIRLVASLKKKVPKVGFYRNAQMCVFQDSVVVS